MSALATSPGTEPVPDTEKKPRRQRETAETMAAKQRDISVSEFFAKNRHLLGFDNPRKALLTTIKEAVDNSLDACEEGGILPSIDVVIEEVGEGATSRRAKGPKGKSKEKEEGTKQGGAKGSSAAKGSGAAGAAESEDKKKGAPGGATGGASGGSSRYRVIITDNGPGIVRKQVEHIFGRLLYGSKFHRLKMSRGQQGIGISAAGMYGLMTTGRPVMIISKTGAKKPAHEVVLKMDTSKNRAEIVSETEHPEDDAIFPEGHGTRVVIELEGKYQKGRGSVDEYIELTAIANPHARFTLTTPPQSGDEGPQRREFPRAVEELPPEAKEIQPHPHGIELGTLIQMLERTESRQLGGFLQNDFCRVGLGSASTICEAAGLTNRTWVKNVDHSGAEKLYKAIQSARLMSPPTDCLSPIGAKALLKGLEKELKPDFIAVSERPPAVYRGRPFLIEAGVAYGGTLPADETSRVYRFANRVPLQYQQSACATFKAVSETDWRRYNLQQPRDGLPVGALVVMVHMASVWVPFTSESKEAIADYDEIRKEMKLALQECGRKLGAFLNRRQKMQREGERRHIFERYIGEIAKACETITGEKAGPIYEALLRTAKKKTERADELLDDEGKVVGKKGAPSGGELEGDETVYIRDDSATATPPSGTLSASEGPPLATPLLLNGAPSASSGRGRKAPGPRQRPAKAPSKRPASSPAPPAKPAKPKYRYTNDGRILPVDDAPGLF